MFEAEFVKPKDLAEAFAIMDEWTGGRIRFIAGGTNLIPYMRDEVLTPALIMDVSGIGEIRGIREEGDKISIGATTTITEIVRSDLLKTHAPILVSAGKGLGNPLVQNRATIGGNLCNASPAADMVPPLLALEAEVHTQRRGGRGRILPVDEFFQGKNRMAMEDDEIMTHMTFAKPANPRTGAQIKLGLRNSGAISLMNISLMLDMDGNRCRKVRTGLCPVAVTPKRAYETEARLEGGEIDDSVLDECGEILKRELTPRKVSIRATADYRRTVAAVLFKRAVKEALKGVAQ